MSTEEVIANLVKKVENRYYGKYRGFVKDNADEEKLGRLKVTIPSVLGDKVAVWAFPCIPFGGNKNQGFLFIPEKKAGVWIEFEEGDPEFPVWVGTFWSKPGGKSELPKPNKADGSEESEVQKTPTCKIMKTKKGHTIQMEDADDKEMVTIVEAKNKHVITLDKDGIKITDGKNKHVITLDKNGIKITDGANKHELILDNKGITISDKVGSNDIKMEAAGITIKSNLIKIGSSGATEPLVMGNQLNTALSTMLVQLNTHTHTGNIGAPTSPPASPATLVLTPALSKKHTVE